MEEYYDREPSDKKLRADYWNKEIARARRFEEDWRTRSFDIVRRYRDDEPQRVERNIRMNIFHSNVDTLKSALYFNTPRPKVTRRFKSNDPAARTTAVVMERALRYQMDRYKFDSEVTKAVEDMLIVGRGILRMRYEPVVVSGEVEKIRVRQQPITGIGGTPQGTLAEITIDRKFLDEQGNEVDPSMVKSDAMGSFIEGEPMEFVGEQSIMCEYVNWQDFTLQPSKCWSDVQWVCFRHLMTREALVDYYGQKGERIPLSYSKSDADSYNTYDDYTQPDMAEVWEVWDKRTGKQIFVATGFNEVLEEFEDPYNLDAFFPMPEPLYGVSTTDTTLPVQEILIYEDQLTELDIITQRIGVLTEALKRRGVYDASFQELIRLSDADDNEFIPVDNMAMLQNAGGIGGVMQEAPLDNLIKALTALYQSRRIVIDTIYELTGISDIMRGQSASRETATAQRIKGQFGSMRMITRQKRLERFLDEIMEMKAELIVENLEPDLLEKITSIQISPETVAVMKDDRLRSYRISVDTEESSAIDTAIDQQRRTDFLTAMVQFLQSVGPLVSSGALGFDQAKTMLLFAARSFPGARELEETLDDLQPPQPQANPADKLVEVEAAKVQADTQKAQADAQVKIAKLDLDRQKTQADVALKQQKLEIDAAKLVSG